MIDQLKDFTNILGVSVLIYITFGLVFLRILKKHSKRSIKSNIEKFYGLLTTGITNGVIVNLEDLNNVYHGIYSQRKSTFVSWDLGLLLQQCLVILIDESEEAGDKKINIDLCTQKIKEFIDEDKRAEPFSDLPEAEKNLLTDINESILKNDTNSINRKINEIATAIKIRKEELDNIKKLNKWSVPLALIGLFFTILSLF